MRKIKCISDSSYNLTKFKVYDVINTVPSHRSDMNIIYLNGDNGEITSYYENKFLIDVTIEYRDSVIDNILL